VAFPLPHPGPDDPAPVTIATHRILPVSVNPPTIWRAERRSRSRHCGR
jgi:hypothetical protein